MIVLLVVKLIMGTCVFQRLALNSRVAAHWKIDFSINSTLDSALGILLHIDMIEVFLVALVVPRVGLMNLSRLPRAVSMGLGW